MLTNLGIATFGNNSYGQCARPIVQNEDYFGNLAVVKNVTNHLELESGEHVVNEKIHSKNFIQIFLFTHDVIVHIFFPHTNIDKLIKYDRSNFLLL